MFEKLRFFSLLVMELLFVVIPTIHCINGCGIPNPGVPPLPCPLVPGNMSAFIIADNGQDMELFEAITNPSSNLANIAIQSIEEAIAVAQGTESIEAALLELMPIISGYTDIFTGILSLFGFGVDQNRNFMQVISTIYQQIIQDAERYADQESVLNDIQQLQANFQTAGNCFNAIANITLFTDDEIFFVEDAENYLDLNYNLFQDQELLSTYSYFFFTTLYVNAMLHMNAYSTLITYFMNNSQVNLTLSTAVAAQVHAIEYFNLLYNFASQAQSWRSQQISYTQSEDELKEADSEVFIICESTFSDNFMNVQYMYCSTEECDDGECGFSACGEENSEEEYANECRNNYYNNLQAALYLYYNQYINSFYQISQQYQSIQIPLAYLPLNNKKN